MTSDSQTGNRRVLARVFAALVLAAVGVAVAQTAGGTAADEEVQAAVEKATVSPIPEVGGARAAGAAGEVSLGSLRANYTYTDVTVKGAMGPVSFVRRYGMDTLGTTTQLAERPERAPFGSMKADAVGPYRFGAPPQCGSPLYPETRGDCSGGLRWRHNFDSWVDYTKKRNCPLNEQCEPEYDVTWRVRDPEGRTLTFEPCSLELPNQPLLPSCFARNHDDSDVKLELVSYGSVFGDAFVLHTPTARYVYAEPWNGTPETTYFAGMVRFRLSHILAAEPHASGCPVFGPDQPCQRRMATIRYSHACVEDAASTLGGGKTYPTSIEVAGGTTLWLDYGAVHMRDRLQLVDHLEDGGTGGRLYPKECVLQRIWLTESADAGPPLGDVPVASYLYAQGPFDGDGGTTSTERLGGLLEEVVLTAGGPDGGVPGTETRLRYEYGEPVLYADGSPSPQPLRIFRVLRNGLLERELVMDAADGAYVKQARVGDTRVRLWADNSGKLQDGGSLFYCHPGRFGATELRESKCLNGQQQHQQAEAVTVGDGSGALVPGVQQDTLMTARHRSPLGALLSDLELKCTGATCSALAPLQRSRAWGIQSFNPCEGQSCPPNWYLSNVFATSSVRDTRGSLTLYDNQLAPDGVGVPPRGSGYPLSLPPLEMSRVRAGASLADGSDALLTRHFSYSYGPTYRQQAKAEWGDSALVPSGEYRVRRHYDAATGRLTTVVQSGYTLQSDAASNSWAPVERHVGTFYRAAYSCSVQDGAARLGEGDARGRVVEVAGPCPVDGPDAQQCAPGEAPVPLTQYEYWPETAGPRLAGRLAVRRVFSRTQADGTCNTPGLPVDPATYLDTRFEDYDMAT